MGRCRLVDLLDRLVPLKAWRGYLIVRHRERCLRCLARLASREEALRFLVRSEDVAPGLNLWPRLRRALAGGTRATESAAAVSSLVWRRAFAAAGAILLAVFGLWLLRSGISVRTDRTAAEASQDSRFKLNYIRIGGEPATAYIYQSKGTDMIVVWAERNP